MSEKLVQLKEILGEVSDLGSAGSILSWDQQVNMPPAGAEARGQQLATLGKIAQEKFTSDEVGSLLEDLKKEYTDPETDEGALIRVTARTYDKAKSVPAEFIAEQAIAATKGVEAWVEAKGKSDFSIFRPHLEKNVELVKKYVSFFPPADHPYDTLLDDYEPGMKTAEVREIFGNLRPKQVELIKAISEAKQVKMISCTKNITKRKCGILAKRSFQNSVMTLIAAGRIKPRILLRRPSTSTMCASPIVLKRTRRLPRSLAPCMNVDTPCMSRAVNPAYERTPLAGGTSLAVHESQSRMWENLVGRSFHFGNISSPP
jgi:carboxypeptidase Taq